MRPLSLKGHDRPLTRIRMNRHGDLLFSAGKNKSPCVWYTENGERIGTYDGHNGVVWDIDVNWDTTRLVSASGDNSVRIWDVETGSCISKIDTPTVARSISLSYSGNIIGFTTNKMTKNMAALRIVDMREAQQSGGENPAMCKHLIDQCNSCCFSHLDDTIVIGSEKGELQMYDLRTFEEPTNFNQAHTYQITDIQMNKDQSLILTSSKDKTAQLLNAKTLDKLKLYKSERPVNSAAISPLRDHIVLGGGEEAMTVTQTSVSAGHFEAKIYHMVFEEEFARFKGHFGPINSIAFHPSGKSVATGGEDGYVRIQEFDDDYLDFDYDY
uniref:Eukaryotic translation initiation factor 3 subunit I n=1 Tax=Steinernema glaseri TaxID=37863 RepID=A0A1I7YEN5_9BILA